MTNKKQSDLGKQMKTPLQARAETAAKNFNTARKPIVFEFAGVPKAGKTSTLNALHSFLKRCGFKVEVVIEKASICPIRDKHHFNFNVWTACSTLLQLLERTQIPPRDGEPDILILDRGLFDALGWLFQMERMKRITPTERQLIEQFLTINDWRKRVSAVFVMTVNPKEAMEREKGLLPVAGLKGSIMNDEVLSQVLKTTNETVEKFQKQFRIFTINTSAMGKDGQQKVAEHVTKLALDVIEEHLREEILFLPKSELFGKNVGCRFIPLSEASSIVSKFTTNGRFLDRDKVEEDFKSVQALPIVVIRKKNGDVLRLKRKEQNPDNPLNEKIVIWAGGHTRKEDKMNGETLLQCILRELQEELRLSVEPNELALRGAIYSDENPHSGKHIALVYEWRAPTDDVVVALNSEFFERRGNSLSGTFVSVENLLREIENEKLTEQWSVEIVTEILAKGKHPVSPRLL
jgi:predicted NUDIX family phosphoesterase